MTERRAVRAGGSGLTRAAWLEAGRRRWQELLDTVPSSEAAPIPEAIHAQAPLVLAASEFVATVVARDPAAFAQLARDDLLRALPAGSLAERVRRAVPAGADLEATAVALRRLRNLMLARIAWRDIAGLATLEQTTGELSALADAILDLALARLTSAMWPELGVPCDAGGAEQHLAVIAMGKLGAGELNFSSDIDLVLVYGAEGQTRGGRRTLDNRVAFERLAKALVGLLSAPTAEGFVFRVDLRLRPFGDSGPLAIGREALQRYFEQHARDWERYAFVKARACAGDRALGEAVLADVLPIVYPRYVDYGAIESLRGMKALVDGEVRRKGLRDDIKRGPGGIREVEFIAQSFQLVRGGQEPRLRQRALLPVLATLGELGYLPASACGELAAAYRLLRDTEHRLQERRDQQTQRLPRDADERQHLAWSLGATDWGTFEARLDAARAAVQGHFDALLAGGEPAAASAFDFWSVEPAELEALLEDALGRTDAHAIAEALRSLRAARALRVMSGGARERLARLVPLLVDEARAVAQPARTLERVFELLRAVAGRPTYLALLLENPGAREQLMRLVAASPWIARELTAQPALLDELIDPRTLFETAARDELERDLRARLAACGDDLERRMDVLRRFRAARVLRVAAADVTGQIPITDVSNRLTYIAEGVVAAALDLAWDDVVHRHGQPSCVIDGERQPVGFAVVAYGKLGGFELGYGSDLDLVFVHDSRGQAQHTVGRRPVDNQTFFTRLVQRLIHVLATRTAAGRAYEVDTRLRPGGEAGLPVTSLAAFAGYQLGEAWTWEHQALVRARPIAGDTATCERVGAIREYVLRRPRDAERLRAAVLAMRARLAASLAPREPGLFDPKHSRGGMTEIEFVVQYLALRHAPRFPRLCRVTDNLRLLEAFAELGVLSQRESRSLLDAYLSYRAAVHRQALLDEPAALPEGAFAHHRRQVLAVWRRVMRVD